jgi:hypothetical protein
MALRTRGRHDTGADLRHDDRGREDTAYDDRVSSGETPLATVPRVVALVAAAIPTVWALVALVRLDWGDGGIDAPPVDVAGLVFTPWVAIGTLVAGLLALAAAAGPDRASKFAVGAILVCVGVAVLVAGTGDTGRWDLEDGHGWLALGVGAVLLVAGALTRYGWVTHRRTRTSA